LAIIFLLCSDDHGDVKVMQDNSAFSLTLAEALPIIFCMPASMDEPYSAYELLHTQSLTHIPSIIDCTCTNAIINASVCFRLE
jgi:hypothetical protein